MNTLFLVALSVETLAGMGFLLMPGPLLGALHMPPDAAVTIFVRLFGSALIGFVILLWFARRSDNLEFRKATAYSLVAYYVASSIVFVIALATGLMNALGWSLVGIHLPLAIWFGYYLVR